MLQAGPSGIPVLKVKNPPVEPKIPKDSRYQNSIIVFVKRVLNYIFE